MTVDVYFEAVPSWEAAQKMLGCALSSRSAASSAWHSSVQSLSLIAFRISGRFKVIRQMLSSSVS